METGKLFYVFLGIYFFIYFLVYGSLLTPNDNNLITQYYNNMVSSLSGNKNFLQAVFSLFSVMWNILIDLLFLPFKVAQLISTGVIEPLIGTIIVILTIPGMIAVWRVVFSLISWFIFTILGFASRI